jgi:hypothetical protein
MLADGSPHPRTIRLFKRAGWRNGISCVTRVCQGDNCTPHRASCGHSRRKPPRLPQKIVGLEPMRHPTAVRRRVAPRPILRGVQVPKSRTLAGDCKTASSQTGLGGSMSRYGRWCSRVLELNCAPARWESLGLRRMWANFGEENNTPKPHATPWDFASFGG